jgi:KDO2-lipid IV(A) lauroyltransferase
VLHLLGTLIGSLFWVVPNKRLSTCRTNIRRCFPELSRWQQQRLVFSNMRETGKGLMEAGRLWLRPANDNLAMIRSVTGEDVVSQAQAEGHGIILATPHLGSWELFGSYCSSRYPLTSMYLEPPMKGLEDLMKSGRENSGGRYVAADNRGVRTLLKSLREGQMIGILPDQVPTRGGVEAPFFGLPALTMNLLSGMASKTGAIVIFGFAERLSWGRGFRLHFLPADDLISTADEAESVARVNAQVEKCIRMAPHQYLWIYKRFQRTTDHFYEK